MLLLQTSGIWTKGALKEHLNQPVFTLWSWKATVSDSLSVVASRSVSMSVFVTSGLCSSCINLICKLDTACPCPTSQRGSRVSFFVFDCILQRTGTVKGSHISEETVFPLWTMLFCWITFNMVGVVTHDNINQIIIPILLFVQQTFKYAQWLNTAWGTERQQEIKIS